MNHESPDASTDLHERLTTIFRENFEQPKLDIRDEFTANDIAGWDSLMQVNLVVSIEEEFDLRFTTEEIAGISCIREMKQSIMSKKAA
jgi:acyl carrier protein